MLLTIFYLHRIFLRMEKVRFAPSPTGFLHIGGARTALFNWMYARSVGGTFILRIEDTDLQRSEKRFEEEILYSMKWLGMDWDELHYQSKRFDLYREHAQKLVNEGKAYKNGDAIFLKMTKEIIKINDRIRGEIEFDTSNFLLRDEKAKPILDENGNTQLKDEVLIKSDGSPAYSFCCVVDDYLMGITCVIRGEDHISNTPKQIMIYKAFGWETPDYAHLPLIMGSDGSRLSKRNGSVAVSDYNAQGFLPDGIMNYLMLLGWSPGDNQEIMPMTEAVEKFSIKKVNKAAAVFSVDKLNWVNAEYIKLRPIEELVKEISEFVPEHWLADADHFSKVVELYRPRLTVLTDLASWAGFLFDESFDLDKELSEKFLKPELEYPFSDLIQSFSSLDAFCLENIEQAFKNVLEKHDLKTGKLMKPVRIALTNQPAGPSFFDLMELLGREKVIDRLKAVFEKK